MIKNVVIGFAAAGLMVTGTAPALAMDDIEHGKTLAVSCLACHGTENLKLDPNYSVPKLWMQNPRYLFSAMKDFKSGKRSYEAMQVQLAGLTEQDLRDLAAYFGDLDQNAGPRPAVPDAALTQPRPVPAPEREQAPKIVLELCSACHGESGGGSSGVPTLAGQYQDYLSLSLQRFRTGERNDPVMGPIAKSLRAQDAAIAAAYFSANTQRGFALRTSLRSDAVWAHHEPIRDAAVDVPFVKTTAHPVPEVAMIDVPAGTFSMGGDAQDILLPGLPRHAVHLRAFRIGRYEVTFEEYDAFALDTRRALPDDEGWGRGSRPVINISWSDIAAFIAWMNKNSSRHFRLPSEAEWEYAARAGSTTLYWWGNDFDKERLNTFGTNSRDRWEYSAPVGQFGPNAFGLYDTAGNVDERVADCWHGSYDGAPVNGSAWLDEPCLFHVVRGGSWDRSTRAARSAGRVGAGDAFSSMEIGFRLAEDIAH